MRSPDCQPAILGMEVNDLGNRVTLVHLSQNHQI